MNAAEKKLLEYIEECNKIDYEQIERFSWEIRADIEKIRFLIGIIKKSEERIETERIQKEYYKKRANNLENKLEEIEKNKKINIESFSEEENHIPGI
jgi:hypothetical protein